jgi:hypothetical protein
MVKKDLYNIWHYKYNIFEIEFGKKPLIEKTLNQIRNIYFLSIVFNYSESFCILIDNIETL